MKKRFQLMLSLLTTLVAFGGFAIFIVLTERYVYQDLIEQAVKDNQVIGEMVSQLLKPGQNLQDNDSSLIASLQETCDKVALPNGGFLCVANSQGNIVAVPGLKPGDNLSMLKAVFSPLGRETTLSYNQVYKTSFKGYYEYPDEGYSDIIVSMPYTQQLQLLVHQDNKKIMEQASRHTRPMLLLGAIVSLLCGFIAFVLINRVVKRYEHKLEGANKALQEVYEEVSTQKSKIEAQGKKIHDSIRYASRIQEAVLPSNAEMQQAFGQAFALYKPRDIVSGDFFWLHDRDDFALLAVLDCTGHGVPGALMSMVGESLLNAIVLDKGITQPKAILESLHQGIVSTLHQSQSHGKDGMEGAILLYLKKERKACIASAMASVMLYAKGEWTEIKGDRNTLGGKDDGQRLFTEHSILLEEGPYCFYFSTDGFYDQFGGEEGKKMGRKGFRALLDRATKEDFSQQKALLEQHLEQWQGTLSQIDDITVVGIQV